MFWDKGLIGPIELKYEEISFYRKRWFSFVLFLIFMPALIVVDFTGDIYALHDYKVYKYKKYKMAKMCIIVMAIALIQYFIVTKI